MLRRWWQWCVEGTARERTDSALKHTHTHNRYAYAQQAVRGASRRCERRKHPRECASARHQWRLTGRLADACTERAATAAVGGSSGHSVSRHLLTHPPPFHPPPPSFLRVAVTCVSQDDDFCLECLRQIAGGCSGRSGAARSHRGGGEGGSGGTGEGKGRGGRAGEQSKDSDTETTEEATSSR